MKNLKQPNYSRYAKYYDAFELAGYEESENLNLFLDDLFTINAVRKVLDFSCGTGAQSVGLARMGYKVLACDLNPEMVALAKKKANNLKNIFFKIGDMCVEEYGLFDACISIFNSVGHLSPESFLQFLKNAKSNLKDEGLFVFDILNYNAMVTEQFEEYKHMNKEAWVDEHLVNHVRNCTLDKKNEQIFVESLLYIQDGVNDPITWEESWEMQIYTSNQIEKYLLDIGFKEVYFFGQNGIEFNDSLSDVILVIAQK